MKQTVLEAWELEIKITIKIKKQRMPKYVDAENGP
jgi:hypothetical protein